MMRILSRQQKGNTAKKTEQQKPEKATRELGLDMLKGVTVLLMVLAHTIGFTHNSSSEFLTGLRQLGDTVSFTAFLFASGALTYIAYLKHTVIDDNNLYIRVINRALKLLLAYYLVAVVSTLHSLPSDFNGLINYVFQIVFLIKVPGYTEFLLPFIFFTLTIIPLKKLYQLLSNSILSAVFAGAAIYFLGFALHNFAPDFPYKSLISGQDGQYSFPVLQYFIVFAVGLSWGKTLIETSAKQKRRMLATSIAFILAGFLFIIELLPLSDNLIRPLFRWPPSIAFLTLGLIYTYLVYAVAEIEKPQTGRFALITKLFMYQGRYLFDFYLVHIILLQLYSLVYGKKFSTPTAIFFLYVLTLTATYAILFIKNKLFTTNKTKTKRSKKSMRLNLPVILVLIALAAFAGSLRLVFYSDKPKDKPTPDKTQQQEEAKDYWWDDNYSYRQNILVKNSSEQNKPAGSWASLTIDHKTLTSLGKTLSSGDDLHIIYQEKDVYRDVPIKLLNPDKNTTEIIFQTFADISSSKTDVNYYLYFGNNLATTYTSVDDYSDNLDYTDIQATLGEEELHPYFISTGRTWFLKGEELLQDETVMNIKTQTIDKEINSLLYYQLVGTQVKKQMIQKNGIYQASVSTEDLNTGTYKVQVISADGKIKSNIVGVKISYPLYVIWSMDWEGYDCNNTYLTSINDLANKYNVPITHFYNPRIYVGLSKTRQTYLDNWIKQRRDNHGDEIEMHMHMFFDMVQAAGVTPIKTPQWTNYKDGKDVPATVYSTEDFTKILNWGRAEFKTHGLGEPIAFRSGAWYANTAILQSIENAGFSIDSSGRTKYAWGTNKIPGFWDLKSTTKPYMPAKANQNIAGTPSFDLYEFPNNGADSWTYSGAQMIARFNENYKNKPLKERQAITYLSHPHGFNVDGPKMTQLFNHINQYAYSYDKGPVKFVRLADAYAGWNTKK